MRAALLVLQGVAVRWLTLRWLRLRMLLGPLAAGRRAREPRLLPQEQVGEQLSSAGHAGSCERGNSLPSTGVALKVNSSLK